jgi:hypothetical protein
LENGKVLCRFEGCCKAVHPTSAAKHERIHTGEKPYKCSVPDCGAAFTEWKSLEHHRRAHENIRPCVCTAEGCHACFVHSGQLKAHVERNHSEQGILRRKLREERVAKFLTAAGIAFDREPVIHFCGNGSKTFARIDFVTHMLDRIVAIECDEDSHKAYSVLCDVTRMLDIAAQHALRSELPLHFVRFNPDAYTVDGQAQKPTMGERYKQLLHAIEAPVSAPLTITYVCYDTTDGVADVMRSDQFPPELRDSCRTVVV